MDDILWVWYFICWQHFLTRYNKKSTQESKMNFMIPSIPLHSPCLKRTDSSLGRNLRHHTCPWRLCQQWMTGKVTKNSRLFVSRSNLMNTVISSKFIRIFVNVHKKNSMYNIYRFECSNILFNENIEVCKLLQNVELAWHSNGPGFDSHNQQLYSLKYCELKISEK